MSALTRRIPRPTPALAVACVALFTALGGTSYAALKITGKNVTNSSLTGADVLNGSLGGKELKKDSVGGSQIDEAALGIVPKAQHALTADNATNAQQAAKAADADNLGGKPASDFMTQKTRGFEANIYASTNFPSGSTLGTLADVPPGTYVVTARLTYDNDGGAASEMCTLHVPGVDDSASFTLGVGATQTVMLQELMTSDAVFSPTVSCSSDGNDDTQSAGSIIAVRLD